MRSGRVLSMLVTVVLVALTTSQARPAPAAAPAFPQWIAVIPGNGAVLLEFHWLQNASVTNVYRRQMGQKPETAGTVPGPRQWFIDNGPDGKGLANGTPLFYSVTAVVDGVEGPASPEVVVTPQLPIGGPAGRAFFYYDIDTLSPGQASLDGKTLTLTASGDGIGDQGDGQRFLAVPIAGDFTLTAELLHAPSVVSGADPASTDQGIVGLEFREDDGATALLPGARYALVGAFVHHDPDIVFEGQKAASGSPPQFFSSGQTSFADAHFPVFLRLQKAGSIIRAFQSADGMQWDKVGDDQDFGPMRPFAYVGFVAAAHKEGAYVAGQFDFSTVSIMSP